MPLLHQQPWVPFPPTKRGTQAGIRLLPSFQLVTGLQRQRQVGVATRSGNVMVQGMNYVERLKHYQEASVLILMPLGHCASQYYIVTQ